MAKLVSKARLAAMLKGPSLVFDLETTGIPQKRKHVLPANPIRKLPEKVYHKRPAFTDTECFNGCRIVSMCWLIEDGAGGIVKQVYTVVRPDADVVFTPESTAIHGITHEEALAQGRPFHEVLGEFMADMEGVSTMVSHNAEFDVSVLKSELYRRGFHDALEAMHRTPVICTMKWGMEQFGVTKYPKLAELYEWCYKTPLQNAHHAAHDTWHCFQCYNWLRRTVAPT